MCIIFIIILIVISNNNISLNDNNYMSIVNASENVNDQVTLLILEHSIWSLLINIILLSIIGLWLYSSYLEYDKIYIIFSLKLLLFLFTVWITISVISLTILLISWELIGFFSFNLIWSWCLRSLTTSSAFSAIGYNRIGDVLLIILITSYIMFIYYYINKTNTSLLVVILFFKSVTFITYLWLPEAMEGPTPVSSLLHSCTLVMAGIFSLYNIELRFNVFIIAIIMFSLLYCILLAKLETDFKRIIATSTVIMVGLLWYLIIISISITAILICIIHATYKSFIFLTSGKLLVKTNIYNDTIYITNSEKSKLFILGIFLIAHKTSVYGNIKHNIDAWIAFSNLDYYIHYIIILNLIILWYFMCKILNNKKHKLSFNTNDFHLILMMLMLLVINVLIIYNSGYTNISITIILITMFLQKYIKISYNIGSVIFNTSLNSINLYKFNLLKNIRSIKSIRYSNNITWLLISIIILILVYSLVKRFKFISTYKYKCNSCL